VRLLYVNSTRRWGGVKSWSLRSARQLAARGHEVVVAGRRGDPFLDACREADLEVWPLSFGPSWSPRLILRFVRLIRRRSIQLTVCNTGRDLSTAGAASRLCGVPVVHRVGSGTDFRDTLARRWTHQAIVSRVLAPAATMARELTERFAWIQPGQVCVSWNAVESPLRNRLPGQPGRLVCLGRLAAGKGLESLLSAVAILHGQGHELQLDLVGEGPIEAELRRRAIELGIGDHVRFTGFIRPVSHVLALASIGILASRSEGFPNVLLDYWSAGLAVVSSDLPGVREAMGESGAARLVPVDDVEALARVLGHLLRDDGEREGLSAAGLDQVRLHFNVEREAGRLERIFAALISPPSQPME
jgi:glycosyltransferase involved in cell wall biosynthesis